MLLCVADVAGKGLPAALVMSNMQATLRALLGRIRSLPMLAGHASDLLYATTSPEKYVTAAFAELVPRPARRASSAPGISTTSSCGPTATSCCSTSTGPPLGLLPPGMPYERDLARARAGDTLVLYSDGVTDAQNAADEEFGETRLHDLLRSLAGQPATVIVDRVLGDSRPSSRTRRNSTT